MLTAAFPFAAAAWLHRSSAVQSGDVITAKTFIAPGHTKGAAGDGRTDDWDSLQKAIDEAIRTHSALRLEPGAYRISKGLVIDSKSSGFWPFGFLLQGEAGPNQTGDGNGGVSIVLDAAAKADRAVLAVGHAPFRDMIIENVGLVSHVPHNATPFGLLFAGTKFSHASIQNVTATFVHTAFGIDQPGRVEANGESVNLFDCVGVYVNCFYSNNSSEALCHRAVSCTASLVNGGVAFKIGSGSLGFNFDSFGFNCSFGPGPLRNTFFENDGVSGTFNFSGGRQELVDTVLSYIGGTTSEIGMVSFNGMQFTAKRAGYPLIDATLNNEVNAQWTNSFQMCQFLADDRKYPKLSIKSQVGDQSVTFFDRCVFQGFANRITDLSGMHIKARDCRTTIGADNALHDLNNWTPLPASFRSR